MAAKKQADKTKDAATTPHETEQRAETGKSESYGRMLHDKIRTETKDFSKLSHYEKFVLDRGFYYHTEADLQIAYKRACKARDGILISEDEFVAEAGRDGLNTFLQWDEAATREVYKKLADLAAAGKLANSDVYTYAYFGWCIKSPDAIVAYETERARWEVNNCDTEISMSRARVEVCEEWGFEASRVKIIGTPYYDATDWQFIN